MDGVDNLKVTAILTNTGNETVRVLNDPRGPLSKLPTDAFEVTKDGTRADFGGIEVKYVPSVAAALGDYTVLKPGESITIDHDRTSPIP